MANNVKIERLKKYIQDVKNMFKKEYGLNVVVSRSLTGYSFVDKWSKKLVGTIDCDHNTADFEDVFVYEKTVKKILEARKRKHFVLQRAAVLGGTLLIAGGIVITSIGGKAEPKTPEKNIPSISIEAADDLTILSWSDYAMGELSSIAQDTEYDGLRQMSDSMYSSYYVPVMSSYYDYEYSKVESPLPESLNDGFVDNYHDAFRSNAYEFNRALNDSGFFNTLSFEQSPYATSVLLNDDDERFAHIEDGQVYDEDNNLIIRDDKGTLYRVYVPITDAKDDEYTIENLPEDVRVVDGVTYVNESHLYDNNKKK